MNGEVKYAVRRSAEYLQQVLIDRYEGYSTPEAQEGNKLAFLLTHTPRQYLSTYGAEEIDSEIIKDCLDTLSLSIPSEVFNIIEHHNHQCRLYEERSARLPVKQYNLNNK